MFKIFILRFSIQILKSKVQRRCIIISKIHRRSYYLWEEVLALRINMLLIPIGYLALLGCMVIPHAHLTHCEILHVICIREIIVLLLLIFLRLESLDFLRFPTK